MPLQPPIPLLSFAHPPAMTFLDQIPPSPAYVYALSQGTKIYIGATNNPVRRLAQHNKLISGGARRTTRAIQQANTPWTFALLAQLPSWNDALLVEWHLKRARLAHGKPQSAYGKHRPLCILTTLDALAHLPRLSSLQAKLMLAYFRAVFHLQENFALYP
jgi:predicted GIY-YIG superfamily endonuclease